MEESVGRFVFLDNLVDEIEVKLREDHCKDTLSNALSEGLPQADAPAAQEWTVAHWVSLGSSWSHIERRSRVEALRDVLVRVNPLLRVSLQMSNVDLKHLSLQDSLATDFDLLSDFKSSRDPDRRVYPQSLADTVGKIVAASNPLLLEKDALPLFVTCNVLNPCAQVLR